MHGIHAWHPCMASLRHNLSTTEAVRPGHPVVRAIYSAVVGVLCDTSLSCVRVQVIGTWTGAQACRAVMACDRLGVGVRHVSPPSHAAPDIAQLSRHVNNDSYIHAPLGGIQTRHRQRRLIITSTMHSMMMHCCFASHYSCIPSVSLLLRKRSSPSQC